MVKNGKKIEKTMVKKIERELKKCKKKRKN